jgi:uncharacterized protein
VTVLLDANVVIALTVVDHVHHNTVKRWFERLESAFATCAITEMALMRFLVRSDIAANTAFDVVEALRSHHLHEYWPDAPASDRQSMHSVVGHRQITDAYLAHLARSQFSGKLATLDRGLAQTHPDITELLDIG